MSETEDYLRKMYLRNRVVIGKLGDRIEKSEREARDIAKDRDQWKARALAAEAELASSPSKADPILMRPGETMDDWHKRVGAPFPLASSPLTSNNSGTEK